MLKIFHAPRTRSLRVVWLAEEMGLPYELARVDFQDKSPAFLAVNPTGALPTVVDDGAVLTESVAILQYMVARHGPTPLGVEPGAPNYADYLQFLVLGEAGLAAPLNAIVGCRLVGKPEDLKALAVKVIKNGFHNRLQLVTRRLAKGPFMAGETFTAADVSVAWAIGFALFLDQGRHMPEAVHDYYRRCTERPAFVWANGL